MSEEFLWSVKNGEVEEVEKFIEKGSKVDELIAGRFPIHYAADYGHKDVIEKLVSGGAKVNVQDKHGIQPLLCAIWEGHTSCVEYLIKIGASKTEKAPDGSTYLECAESLECADKDKIKQLLSD